jgi:hypothetical protein
MKYRIILGLGLMTCLSTVLVGAEGGKAIQVSGFVIDSACAYVKNLDKPISRDCAIKCAKAGSPLVILSDDRTVYWPIADTTPASGQNGKLMPFAGERVKVNGTVYDRGGSKAIVISKIEEEAAKK